MESAIEDRCEKFELTPTSKEFLNDSYKFELTDVKLLKVETIPGDENNLGLIFDKTISHPQGGGQPSDEGELTNKQTGKIFKIQGLIYDRARDVIIHKVSKIDFNNTTEDILMKPGTLFNMKINNVKRMIYARLHSAGHLLDTSVSRLGLNLIPGKGYHFVDGPYVEYTGNIDKSKINELKEKMEKTMNELITNSSDDDGSIVKFYSYNEGLEEFNKIPDYLPKDKPFRWVKLMKEDYGCPCGGTHVKHIKDIESIKINKITNKGKIVRISYNIKD